MTPFCQLVYERSYYQHKESKQYAYLVDANRKWDGVENRAKHPRGLGVYFFYSLGYNNFGLAKPVMGE